jgi:hypothetical protein
VAHGATGVYSSSSLHYECSRRRATARVEPLWVGELNQAIRNSVDLCKLRCGHCRAHGIRDGQAARSCVLRCALTSRSIVHGTQDVCHAMTENDGLAKLCHSDQRQPPPTSEDGNTGGVADETTMVYEEDSSRSLPREHRWLHSPAALRRLYFRV